MSCGVGPAKITVRLNFSRLVVQPALVDYRELISSCREIEDVSRLDLAAFTCQLISCSNSSAFIARADEPTITHQIR